MPGNEVGDRVHNFFGQDKLSQGQYHSQTVDENWPRLNNLWAGSQRSNVTPFFSNCKNFNLQQSDSDQGQISSPHLRRDLNLLQSNLRPDPGRNNLPNQQTAVNGYMQGHQIFQTRQNEANISGVDTESDWHSQSRGMPALESQGSGLEHYKKNADRNDAAESPVSFDFFGGQQQISGRHSGMLQSLPRQQLVINETHLLQQQAMLNHMQGVQRQQLFHQLEARQQNTMTPASSFSKQEVASHPASLINGIPINEAPNLVWQPEVVPTNVNWPQREASHVMPGSSNGYMLTPEQGQALRLMGFVPNQGDQSLYGLPVPGSRVAPNLYSHGQADKPAVSQVSIQQQYSHLLGDKSDMSASENSFSSHQYAPFSDQTNSNDGTSVSRQDIHRKSMFNLTAHGINSGLHMENFQQVNSEQRILPMQEFHGRQELAESSEMSQDRMIVQDPPSQNVATLDPTEEKILFGSDDSLWDGFGGITGSLSLLDGTDSLNGLPSNQNGSWSALMQSAVAEKSSAGIGIQEEWSGLSFQSMECSSINERPSTIDSGKQHSVWTDSNLQSTSNVNSRPFLQPNDVCRLNSTENYAGVSGIHRSGPDASHEQHGRLQMQTDSHRSVPQFLEKGKWLDCSPQQKQHAEGGHAYGSVVNSSGFEKNEKATSDSWTHQHAISSSNSSGGPFDKSNGWDVMKSAPLHSSTTCKALENENTLQPHSKDPGRVPAMREPGSDTNSSVGFHQVKSAGNTQIFGEDSGANRVAALPNSGAAWRSNRQLPNIDPDLAGNYRRNDASGKYRPHSEMNPLILESSNGKVESEVHIRENSNQKEQSADGLGSNHSHHIADGVGDGSNVHSPKISGQGNRKHPVTRKFQYHPMGDVDDEMEPYGNKHIINSQPQTPGGQKGHGHSYLGQSEYGHYDGNHAEMEKVDSKSLDNNTSKIIHPVHMPKTSSSFDRNVGNYALNKAASPRMIDTESSEGPVVHHQHSSSSQGFGLQLAPPTQRLPIVTSHGLAGTGLTTPHVSESGNRGHTWLGTNQAFPYSDSSHGELRKNVSATAGLNLDKASQYSALGNVPQAFPSGFPFSRINPQNQNMANLGGQVSSTQSANATCVDLSASMNRIDEYHESAQTSQSELESAHDMSAMSDMDQIFPGDSAIQILAAETGTLPSGTCNARTPSKVLHNVWTSVSSEQHASASKIPFQSQQINICEMITDSQRSGDENSEKGGPCSPYSNSSIGNLHRESSGQKTLLESVNAAEDPAGTSQVKMSDPSQPSPAATSRDIEAFGRSLRPNNSQNFSLWNQVQSMRNVDIDPNNQDDKRFQVSDNVVERQHIDSNSAQQLSYGYDNMVKDMCRNNSSGQSTDPDMLCFPNKPGAGQDTNASCQEVVGYGQKNVLNHSDSNRETSVRSNHALVNPQMAPSWFEKYGTFRNGKVFPMYDVQKMNASKIMDQPFIVRNQLNSMLLRNSTEQVDSLSDAQPGNVGKGPMPASEASELVPPLLSTPLAVESDLLIMRSKKRKTSTSELLPWHKELTQAFERLPNISTVELDWAQASNRLIEKVANESEVVEDFPVAVKSKRRLILTTQLMQQLLSPPPAAVLFADVKSHHDSVLYSISRLSLGEACSSISQSGYVAILPPSSQNLKPETPKSPKKNEHYILKVTDLVVRAKKLENDISRLDSRASILDLRVECQDLERFSVINRFAKFHGRPQNYGAETSSSSEAGANSQKSFSQRYVTAVPLPRNLPDRVQCLSL